MLHICIQQTRVWTKNDPLFTMNENAWSTCSPVFMTMKPHKMFPCCAMEVDCRHLWHSFWCDLLFWIKVKHSHDMCILVRWNPQNNRNTETTCWNQPLTDSRVSAFLEPRNRKIAGLQHTCTTSVINALLPQFAISTASWRKTACNGRLGCCIYEQNRKKKCIVADSLSNRWSVITCKGHECI